jgi:hypothetical protein
MEQQHNVQENGLAVAVRRVGFVAGGYALRRVRIVQPFYADTKAGADIHIDAILARGNYASMINYGGQFVVKELVMA